MVRARFLSGPHFGGLATAAVLIALSYTANIEAFFIPLPDTLRQGVVLGTIASPSQDDNQGLLTIVGTATHPASDKTTAFIARITHDDLLDSRFGSSGLVWLEKAGEKYSRATEIKLVFNQYHIPVISVDSSGYATTLIYVLDLDGLILSSN